MLSSSQFHVTRLSEAGAAPSSSQFHVTRLSEASAALSSSQFHVTRLREASAVLVLPSNQYHLTRLSEASAALSSSQFHVTRLREASAVLPSSQYHVTRLSEASAALSSSQFHVTTLPPSRPTVSSRSYSVTSSSSQYSNQSRVTLSSGQPLAPLPPSPTSVTISSNNFGVTLSSSQSHVTLAPSQSRISLSSLRSQSHGTLSLSKFQGTPSSALPTSQEGIANTVTLEGTTNMYSTLEALKMLSSSFLSDRTIPRTNSANNAGKTSISTLIWYPTVSNFKTQPWPALSKSLPVNSKLIEDNVYASGQPGLTPVSISSITSSYSAFVISRTIFQLRQSIESSHAIYATNGDSSLNKVGLTRKTSASLHSSLSVSGDLPMSQMKPSPLVISQSSTNKASNLTNLPHEDSLVTGTPASSVAVDSLHQEPIQKTRYASLLNLVYMHNQTGLAGIISHATDSTPSPSKASILNSHHNEESSWESWNYHFYSNSKSNIRNAYFSTSVDGTSNNTLALSSIPSWNRSIMATVGFLEKTVIIGTKFSSLSRTSGNIFTH